MGCCLGQERTKLTDAHVEIDEHMREHKKQSKRTIEVLLLGAGGSGKSTVVKQMRNRHEDLDLNDEELKADIKESIIKMMFTDLYDLCEQNRRFVADNDEDCKIEGADVEELVKQYAAGDSLGNDDDLNPQKANQMLKIWRNKGIQNTFAKRKLSNVMDSTPYFFDKILDMAKDSYVVTFDDYIRIRDKTTGILNYALQAESKNRVWTLNVTDVGGQRSERRKWISVFSGVDVVLYVMSLSGYNQKVYEDNDSNCYDETFAVFEKTVRNKLFAQTDFIVFLNKLDLFNIKINNVPFTVYKPDFDANFEHDSYTVIQWVQAKFKSYFEHHENARTIFFHETCATDTRMMDNILSSVQSAMITKRMVKAGIL